MTLIDFKIHKAFSEELDQRDELSHFRDSFIIKDPSLIYLDGNSLGRLAKPALVNMPTVIEKEWGHDLVRGWNTNWYEAPIRIGEKIAALAGAAPGQMIVSDSTSVNLFKLTMAALAYQPGRTRIVSDVFNFPSDLYVLQGCIRVLGDRHKLHLVPSKDHITIDPRDLCNAIDDDTALVTLSHVAFKSGYLHDAEMITRHAHAKGALVLWDLCHSIGVVPIELDHWQADLAIGCTYKYLNGGPGSPAFLYVAKKLQDQMLSPIYGWFGQNTPFAFDLQYQPADGIQRFLSGTPPILSLLAIESGLDLIVLAGIDAIRRKSVLMTSYMAFLVENILVPFGFKSASPADPALRGSHISIQHPSGYQIVQALIREMKVLPDFREPDNIRLGMAPLYTSFSEIWEAVDRIKQVMETRQYRNYPAARSTVT